MSNIFDTISTLCKLDKQGNKIAGSKSKQVKACVAFGSIFISDSKGEAIQVDSLDSVEGSQEWESVQMLFALKGLIDTPLKIKITLYYEPESQIEQAIPKDTPFTYGVFTASGKLVQLVV